jgi:muconolactone D-isomerase
MTNTALTGATYDVDGGQQIVRRPTAQGQEGIMEFLVEFQVNVPDDAAESEVSDRETAEAAAAARLADEGHLVRVWRQPVELGESKVLGLYRADSERELDGLLRALPLHDWMHITVTPLEPHPNDPAAARVQP